MSERKESLLEQWNILIEDRFHLRQIITSLSLIVVLLVFWSLKLTGIGIAGEAFCGMPEHIHSEECPTPALICQLPENEEHSHSESCYDSTTGCQQEPHVHTESCYSNINADLETCDDWEMTLADLTRGPTTRENVILVAQSQLGYTESQLNFQVDTNGVRRGITRYGQWYGNPYGDWSAMFVSFCLSYAGADDAPCNAGPEAMRLEWEAAGMYSPAADTVPIVGNLVFLAKDTEQGTAKSVAIITGLEETAITVIEGDLDGTVAETQYSLEDPAILGYGIVPNGEPIMLMAASRSFAKTISYNTNIFNSSRLFVIYTTSNNQNYAIDGNGNAVPITIDGNGNISADISNPDSLLWSVTASGNNYVIHNATTNRYMNITNNGVIGTNSANCQFSTSGSGVRIRTNNNNNHIKLTANATGFERCNQASASVFSFGYTQRCTVWLDGTDGGLGYLTGSPNTAYSVSSGGTFALPTAWTSPSKYSYRLRGWYDVTNSRYYLPGEEITVTGNMVLYADWVANTYDIGQFNAQVADSVSTSSFITTYMFDYNYLFNVQSSNVQVTVDSGSHSESWSMVTSGTVNYKGQQTFDFVFTDNDGEGSLNIPSNRSNRNKYHDATTVTKDIYSAELGELLFSPDNAYDPSTGTGILGKTYLGTGDYLFQIMDDPSDEHYGYYYYDSKRNAASYNQSTRRFYVYDYLAATSDSIGGVYSDFLPLNSPYANTNGKTVGSYTYAGIDNEYTGVSHIRYDSKYNSGDHNSTNGVYTDYAYGMRMDITFYLPNDPGSGGNKDMYGNDMQFQFSGDDDLWVLIDGKVVLDIGGIHQIIGGVIDLSTGMVEVNGVAQTSLMDLGIKAGDHTLTLLYLERGASMSNCAIYFNLAPRFGLELRKEDILTQELLDGTQFTVYEDFACTQPAELWISEAAYRQDLADGKLNSFQSTFTIKNGIATLWGLGSGNTYYIKETGPPDKQGYAAASGVIRLTIEREGQATYLVDVIADAEGNHPSKGFTVHGVTIDESTQTVYVTVTNAPSIVTETTTVQVVKQWQDAASHSGDYIQAYLTATGKDGTTRRIREVTLSDENDWMYIWTNLPKYDYDNLTEVVYGIEESYESGYYSTVRRITQIELSKTTWAESMSFQDKQTYILRSGSGYLSTLNGNADTGYKWVDEQTAKSSPNALWTASVSGGTVKFTNGLNQTITLYYNGGSPTDFYARVEAAQSADRQNFSYSERGGGLQIFYQNGNTKYYLTSSMNNSSKFSYNTDQNKSMILTPVRRITESDIREVEDWAYQITNIPLPPSNETALSVRKAWDIPAGYDSTLYQEFSVTVQLLANGVNTGRNITLNLKNNWKGSFLGLPYKDDNGNVITYTVVENWQASNWSTNYGEIVSSGGSPPTYSTVITNTFSLGGPMLPSTGSAARLSYVLCGSGIMLGSLVYAIGSRRKRERRME